MLPGSLASQKLYFTAFAVQYFSLERVEGEMVIRKNLDPKP